ncbi:MAG: phage major capsid protein [Clostridia bacterium]|nr:phage major capsid protein [Clostridia bacterium]
MEAIREAEEEAFFCGNGKGKPLGLVYQAEVGASCDSLNTLSFDDILDLIHSLNPAYRESAVFIMSEKAENALRKIKTYRGKPVWTKGLTNDLPDKLFGFPVYSTNKLYDDSNNNRPILFGDFKYLWIGDRGKRAVKRLTECYAERGQVAYMTSERVDAKLVLPKL